ncbi:MAG: response regulator [Burkholderiaceae bacterium]|nr:response regulator [Burkholderiaceae bacterium]
METQRPWVAIVDDDLAIRRALLRLLRSVGIEARAFASGAEFFAALQPCPPDCVLLDLQMPEMSGYAVLARLSAEKLAIPAIVITGQHTAGSQARAVLANAMCYLLKPVSDKLLLDAISLARRHGAVGDSSLANAESAVWPAHGQ